MITQSRQQSILQGRQGAGGFPLWIWQRSSSMVTALTRDPKDDYLLAYALVGQADYLVTGDHDLLALQHVGDTQIVTTSEFWEILKGR